MKKVTKISRAGGAHWVGDGFPVRTMFSYHQDAKDISPFLLLDYAGPFDFKPADKPRGVEFHPHRGFETVTIAYQGEVEHKDTAGHSGKISSGDVQWMTAARGVLHEEMHSAAFTQKGGVFEAVQLWVNLPSALKMTSPRYQELTSLTIPEAILKGGRVRVIAGDYFGTMGAAQTATPVNLWDVALYKNTKIEFSVPEGHTAMFLVMRGRVRINGEEAGGISELVCLDRTGTQIIVEACEDSALLFLGGEPIDEPVVGYGPFVMNSDIEIKQAVADFEAGRFDPS